MRDVKSDDLIENVINDRPRGVRTTTWQRGSRLKSSGPALYKPPVVFQQSYSLQQYYTSHHEVHTFRCCRRLRIGICPTGRGCQQLHWPHLRAVFPLRRRQSRHPHDCAGWEIFQGGFPLHRLCMYPLKAWGVLQARDSANNSP